MDRFNFYNTVSSCTNTVAQCPNTLNSPETGWIPRGYYTNVDRPPVSVMAVCKNPGHLLPGEDRIYIDAPLVGRGKAHMDHASITFDGGNLSRSGDARSTIFHRNLRRYLSFLLEVAPQDVFKHAAYTNLVKCSSPGERDPLNPKTMRECFTKHFVREIEYFRPKALIAFSREVENYLLRTKQQGLHDLPVIYLKHPSYHYRRDLEVLELTRAKQELAQWVHVQ